MSSTEVAQHRAEVAEIVPDVLIDVVTGETLPATVENVPRVLSAAREMKQRIQGVIEAATATALEASRIRGTKTLHLDDCDVVLSGGASTEYDPEVLAEMLRSVECPEDRINEVVVAKVEYVVNRSVLRQLVGANPEYAAAADLAKREVEKPWRASVRTR